MKLDVNRTCHVTKISLVRYVDRYSSQGCVVDSIDCRSMQRTIEMAKGQNKIIL